MARYFIPFTVANYAYVVGYLYLICSCSGLHSCLSMAKLFGSEGKTYSSCF
nr:MAG TPA: hypothetical protein [Crassvirales sp.]DAO10549.1 MAG TPA: hypothetical protein [Bacteriophage sp.]